MSQKKTSIFIGDVYWKPSTLLEKSCWFRIAVLVSLCCSHEGPLVVVTLFMDHRGFTLSRPGVLYIDDIELCTWRKMTMPVAFWFAKFLYLGSTSDSMVGRPWASLFWTLEWSRNTGASKRFAFCFATVSLYLQQCSEQWSFIDSDLVSS